VEGQLRLGNHTVLGLRAENCRNGDVLAEDRREWGERRCTRGFGQHGDPFAPKTRRVS